MPKMTTEELIERFKQVHGNRYDYSLVEYTNWKTKKVKIICIEHEIFEQRIDTHLIGRGCIKCAYVNQTFTLYQLTEKFDQINPNRDWELYGDYNGYENNILVKNKYGISSTKCVYLIKGFNPSIKSAVDKTSYWINMAKEIHGDRYIYDSVDYNGCYGKMKIECRKHGIFIQSASTHLQGKGCPKCFDINMNG